MPKEAIAKKIEVWPLENIKPYWRNPRKIDRRAIEAVKTSINEYGYVQPIVVDKDGVIVIGHVRYRALQELQVEKAQVIIVNLPKGKVKELRLVDNRISEYTRWDEDKLFQELAELVDEAPEIASFFPEFELPDAEEIVDNLSSVGADLVQESEDDGTEIEESDPYSVSHQDVLQAEVKIESEPQRKKDDNIVNVTCPHCGEEFGVDVKRLMMILETKRSS